jgi:hypothetical protein
MLVVAVLSITSLCDILLRLSLRWCGRKPAGLRTRTVQMLLLLVSRGRAAPT